MSVWAAAFFFSWLSAGVNNLIRGCRGLQAQTMAQGRQDA